MIRGTLWTDTLPPGGGMKHTATTILLNGHTEIRGRAPLAPPIVTGLPCIAQWMSVLDPMALRLGSLQHPAIAVRAGIVESSKNTVGQIEFYFNTHHREVA